MCCIDDPFITGELNHPILSVECDIQTHCIFHFRSINYGNIECVKGQRPCILYMSVHVCDNHTPKQARTIHLGSLIVVIDFFI